MKNIRNLDQKDLKSVVLSALFPVSEGEQGMDRALDMLFKNASQAIEQGATILIISDKGVDKENAALPSLLVTAGLHHHLLRERTRTRVGIAIETGEAREMMHFSILYTSPSTRDSRASPMPKYA